MRYVRFLFIKKLLFNSANSKLIVEYGNIQPRIILLGGAIPQWIRLSLPSCRPEFESQALLLSFFPFIIYCTIFVIVLRKRRNKQKEAGFGPFLKHHSSKELFANCSLSSFYVSMNQILVLGRVESFRWSDFSNLKSFALFDPSYLFFESKHFFQHWDSNPRSSYVNWTVRSQFCFNCDWKRIERGVSCDWSAFDAVLRPLGHGKLY